MNFFKHLFRKELLPKINIKYGRLIDPVFTFYCQNNPELKARGWNDWTPPSKEELDRRIKAYKEEWGKYTIVKDISRVLNLSFKRNIMDVYIVSGISRASSHPIIIKSGFKPKEFVVTLAHELIHVILTDNKIKKIVFDEKESDTTNNHVRVYAILRKILNQDLWDTEIKLTNNHGTDEYNRAVALSEKIGPDEIIKKVRAN